MPVELVNLPLETDIKTILELSEHDKRVTFDLDEVVFCSPNDVHREKSPNFARTIRYRKAIRVGIPALFWFFKKQGYDIWLYSSNYYSADDMKEFFRAYSATVDGVISGVGRGGIKDFMEFELSGEPATWSGEVINIVKDITKIRLQKQPHTLRVPQSPSFFLYKLRSAPPQTRTPLRSWNPSHTGLQEKSLPQAPQRAHNTKMISQNAM